ncbi:MAG: hypothetical protein QW165_04210 [Candidatus Woesearchaeota archaeon]
MALSHRLDCAEIIFLPTNAEARKMRPEDQLGSTRKLAHFGRIFK